MLFRSNKENSIQDTILSILGQDYGKIEVIIVNDGSTDSSIEKIVHFNDSRIKVFNKSNGGVSSARNHGIDQAMGEYIVFLDADDTLAENAISNLYSTITLYPDVNLTVGNFNFVSKVDGVIEHQTKVSQTKVISNPFWSICKRDIFLRTGNFIVQRDLIKGENRFDPSCTYYEDMGFILKLLESAKVAYFNGVVLNYNLDFNELSKKLPNLNKDWCYKYALKNYSVKAILVVGPLLLHNLKDRYRLGEYGNVSKIILRHNWLILLGLILILLKKFIRS